MKYFLTFIIIFCASNQVEAACKYNGKEYPENTVVNGYVCSSDNKWKKQDD